MHSRKRLCPITTENGLEGTIVFKRLKMTAIDVERTGHILEIFRSLNQQVLVIN